MADCPTALSLHKFLTDQSNLPALQRIANFDTLDDVKAIFKDHGIDFDQCDHQQALRVVHQYLCNVPDDELLQAQGGEVKVTAITVGVVVAAGIGGAAAVSAGAAVGGAAATGRL